MLNDSKSKEMLWILELMPVPVSSTTLGGDDINPSEPMTLEMADRLTREIGLKGRCQLNLPKDETSA